MSYAQFIVKHYKEKNNHTYETVATTLPAHSTQIRSAIGDKRDTFQFKITNINNEYSLFFKPGDKVDINILVNEDAATEDNLRMSGIVKSITKDLEATDETFIIEGVTYGEVVMNALVFLAKDAGSNSISLLQDMVNEINRRNQAFLGSKYYITWNADNPTGSEFPTIEGDIREFYKSALSVIDKYLRQPFVSNNKVYYWYVNTDNELVIRERDNTIAQTSGANVTLVDGTNFHGIRIGADVSDVKNFIVYKCGRTPDGRIIMSYQDNAVSRVQHGFKYHILIREEIANAIISNEEIINSGLFEDNTQHPTTYPYTTAFYSTISYTEAGVTATAGSQVTVDDDAEYNFAIKKQALAEGRQIALAFTANSANGYLQITGDVPLSLTYQVGQLIDFTSERFGYVNKLMRIQDLNYTLDGLRIVMREDQGTI